MVTWFHFDLVRLVHVHDYAYGIYMITWLCVDLVRLAHVNTSTVEDTMSSYYHN